MSGNRVSENKVRRLQWKVTDRDLPQGKKIIIAFEQIIDGTESEIETLMGILANSLIEAGPQLLEWMRKMAAAKQVVQGDAPLIEPPVLDTSRPRALAWYIKDTRTEQILEALLFLPKDDERTNAEIAANLAKHLRKGITPNAKIRLNAIAKLKRRGVNDLHQLCRMTHPFYELDMSPEEQAADRKAVSNGLAQRKKRKKVGNNKAKPKKKLRATSRDTR